MSKDGKWRSFPKVPHLLQYVSSGTYFGKLKIKRKSVRQSLETTVWSTAQLKLNDFLKERRENRNKVDPPLFKEAWERYKRELDSDTTIKPKSKEYRLLCLKKIETTWPVLWKFRLNEIKPQACKDWAAGLGKPTDSKAAKETRLCGAGSFMSYRLMAESSLTVEQA